MKSLVSLTIVAVVFTVMIQTSSSTRKNVLDTLMRNYDQLEAPLESVGNTTLVNISTHIAHIYGLSAKKEELTVGMYLRAFWNDPRLAYNDSVCKDPYLSVYDWKYRIYVWKPDIFFVDAKSADIPKKPMPTVMMRIYKDGRVFVSYRLIANIYCAMDWSRFPMDVQRCPIKLELYSYYKAVVTMNWHYNHTLRSSLKTWPIDDFYFLDSKQWSDEAKYSGGTYQGMTLDLYFGRNFSYYMRQIYLPALILVLLAYIPCWLREEAEFSRLVLLLALLGCMLVLNIVVADEQPVPMGVYVTAMEVWLASCTAFVAMSLLQTVLVRGTSNGISKTSKGDTIPLAEAGPDATGASQMYSIELPAPRVFGLVMTLDMIWRILYPIMILLFNIIYWPIYSA